VSEAVEGCLCCIPKTLSLGR